MCHRIVLVVVAALVVCGSAGATVRRQPLQIFVLAGQSNMVGFGQPVPREKLSARILRVASNGRAVPAVEPIFPYDAAYDGPANPGVGPGYWFARYLVAHDKKIRVALAPCAASGTRIAEWQKGQPLYDGCMAAARAAVKRGGHVAGVLFFQGESDAGAAQDEAAQLVHAWAGGFASFVASVRADLGARLPVVFAQVETPPATGWPDFMVANYALMRDVQATIRLPGVAMIQTSDLPYGVDPVSAFHFSPAAYQQIGARFGKAFMTTALASRRR